MIFTPTDIDGGVVIELKKIEDERGSFARAFCKKEFDDQGLKSDFVQGNTAVSHRKGTLRGMHYQQAPYAEAKLVRCIRGAVFDVAIDLRPASATYCQWVGVELTAENNRLLYVPEGFAHGYQALADNTELFYLVSQFYTPQAEKGVRWNDPRFGIAWPISDDILLSDKDRTWPDFTPE
jgi:dTDP-4-dehydrorhamnose 3,5-epimerase